MKKGKFKNGDIIEIYKPFLMLIEFMTAFACMYICMVDDSIYFGIAAIFMGWQAGQEMKFMRYIDKEIDDIKSK